MSGTPLVSVVMPVYNGERFLQEAIESILNQTFSHFEFIIINDGSTDNTATILDHYQRIDSRIRVSHQQKQGLIASLNKGSRMARGEYIARMDADDIAFSDRIERQVNFLDQNPTVAVLGGAIVCIDEKGVPVDTICYPTQDRQIKEALLRYSRFAHPTIMIRKQAFHAVNGYRKAFLHAEDYDLWLRIAERYELANLPGCVLYYRLHPDQICVRNLKQQIISTLGAQAAAKARRETGHDPMWQVERVTRDVLSQLGISGDIVKKALVGGYLMRVSTLMELSKDNRLQALRLLAKTVLYYPPAFLTRPRPFVGAALRVLLGPVRTNQLKSWLTRHG